MATCKSRIVRRVRPLVVLSTLGGRSLNVGAAHAIADQARELGWDLLDLRFTKGALPRDRAPRGALVECLPTDLLAARLRKIGCPAVRMGRLPHPGDNRLPAVLPDLRASGRLAAEHFAGRGFRHVGYVGRKPLCDSRGLYEGLRARIGELKGRCHLLQLRDVAEESGPVRYARRAREVGRWLAAIPKPVGLLTFSDAEAASLCTMCQEAGFAVPEEVAVLGHGNSVLDCEMAPVALSSVDPALDECGRQAVRLLYRMMNGGSGPRKPITVLPRGVVARRSTDVLAVADPTVARAMRFMWDHLDQNLSVDDVAQEVATPRRKVERAFRRHLARGINAELRRKRLERCCELLRSTSLTVTDIAPMVGFRSGDYLHASFRQAYGMTPRQYRVRKVRAV